MLNHAIMSAAPRGRTGNRDCKIGPKKPLKAKEVWAIRFDLQHRGLIRDRALFDMAIDSKLRGCDLVKLRISDVLSGAAVRSRAMVIQQKTGRPVQFEITETTRESTQAWLGKRGGDLSGYLFPSRIGRCDHLGTRQYARLVTEWVEAIGLRPEEYGTHSLRRTKASLIYRRTGNLRAVQILLGHTKIESTVRYLGVDIEDALNLAEGTDV
jgi:integrase